MRAGEAPSESRFFAAGGFFTPDRKARFIAPEPPALREATSAAFPLRLNTGRIRDQWHTMTRTGLSPRLATHLPEPFVEVHPRDAATAGLTDGGFARVSTAHGACVVKVVVSDGQQPGSLFVPIHWSDETASCARVGELVSPHTDPYSGQPEAKATPAAIAPVALSLRGFTRTRTHRAVALPAGTWWVRVAVADGAEYRLATNQGPMVWHDFAYRALAGEARAGGADSMARIYRAAAFVDGELDGCLCVGPADASLQWDAAALHGADGTDGARLTARISTRPRSARPSRWSAPASASASRRSAQAVACGAVRTVAEIGRALRAGTNCGSCLPELKESLSMNASRTRLRRGRRAWSRWRGCRSSSRSTASARWSPAARPAAAWKAELLSAAGAAVDVYAEQPCDEMLALAADPPGGAIVLHDRAWQAEDLAGAAIAVGAFEDDREAARFAAAARAAGVPVNVIDKPALLRFLVRRDRQPLAAGDRHFDRRRRAGVRRRRSAPSSRRMIPRGFARWADAARRWRAAVQVIGPLIRRRGGGSGNSSPPSRSRIPTVRRRKPTSMRCWMTCEARAPMAEAGSVTLVGAGPGDPELLTLARGARAAIGGRHPDRRSGCARDPRLRPPRGEEDDGRQDRLRPSCKQDEINALMILLAKAGKRVVRLKGGDPMIFGRAGEEIAACRAAGIAVEVVPGITAAQGAAAGLASR